MLMVMSASVTGILLERHRRLGDHRPVRNRARAVLGTAAGVHFLHDGFSEILYVLLPVWAAEFQLTFAQVGLIRTAYTGGMAALQIPFGVLSERWGERRLLAAGTAITGWRAASAMYGVIGVVAALVILVVLGRLSAGGADSPDVLAAARGSGW